LKLGQYKNEKTKTKTKNYFGNTLLEGVCIRLTWLLNMKEVLCMFNTMMWSCHYQDTDRLWCIGLCQVVITKTSQTMSYLL